MKTKPEIQAVINGLDHEAVEIVDDMKRQYAADWEFFTKEQPDDTTLLLIENLAVGRYLRDSEAVPA